MQFACDNISIDWPHMVVITYKYERARAIVAVTRDWKIQLHNKHLDSIVVSLFGNMIPFRSNAGVYIQLKLTVE